MPEKTKYNFELLQKYCNENKLCSILYVYKL